MIRAKFVCNWKQTDQLGNGQQISLSPVYSGSDENKQFFALTPGGSVLLHSTNPDASAAFEEGQEYYVDFTPAIPPAPAEAAPVAAEAAAT